MSLVQSFINQIGREIGRDVYHSLTSNKSLNMSYDKNTLTVGEKLDSFKLSSYDKLTMNNLVNLVEDVSKLSPNQFQNYNYFIECDTKIDFCKEHLDPKYLPQLEKLDELNQSNLKDYLFKHKLWIAQIHETIEQKINSYKEPNKWLMRSTNFWFYVWTALSIFVITKYSSFGDLPGHWLFWVLQFFIVLGFMNLSFFNREEKIQKIIDQHKSNVESLALLEKYFEEITKI